MNIKKQILLISLVLLILIALVSVFVQKKLQTFQTQEYIKDAKEIKNKLNTFIEIKKKSTLAIAIALSDVDMVQNILKPNNSNIEKNCLISLSKIFKYNTNYKNVWIQVINTQGVSLLRSWTDHKGDSLINVRTNLKELLKNPHPVSTISTGKYTISLKSIVPIYDKGTFIGFVEVITHFNSIAEELKHNGFNSLLLVDRKYTAQLTKKITHKFINDYYIANFTSDDNDIKLIQKIGLSNILQSNKQYLIENNFFISHNIIKDVDHKPMAYYILMRNIDSFNYTDRDKFSNFVHYIAIFGVILVIFLTIIFYKRQQDIEAQGNYFHNIVDTASEIIIIIQNRQAIDVNRAFFTFFHEYKTLKDFHNDTRINCICDLFIEEEGFITSTMGDESWIEYIERNPKFNNKIKLMHDNKQYIFTASIMKLPQTKEDTYTLALSDITQMEKYKDRLEYISQTDTLTAIGNRYYFDMQIKQELIRTKRYKSDLALVMLDIDLFKNVNDTYGHDVGDKALIALSNEIKLLLRHSDIFCRYGGEEFMIIMPETSVIEANISAQRIRKHIEMLNIPPIAQMTISLGITQLLENDTVDSIIKRVDEALYTSKENGRNRVTSL